MNNENVLIDGFTGEIESTLPPKKNSRYRCELDTVSDVKREMAKIYRECRSNLIDAQTGTKLTWMLGELRKTIETSEFEKRIESLEQQAVK